MVLLVSCGPSEAETQAAREKQVADSLATLAAMEKSYTVDPAASSVNWKGNMTGAKVYNHTGTLALTNGSFTIQSGIVTGGMFEVDMTTITPTDEAYSPDGSKEGTRSHLIGHLSSPDFFDVANNPRAALKITGAGGNTATAELTIRGKTHSETITDIVVTENADGTATASGKLVFDRQKYDAAWAHPLKDLLLANNIELTVNLTGSASAL